MVKPRHVQWAATKHVVLVLYSWIGLRYVSGGEVKLQEYTGLGLAVQQR